MCVAGRQILQAAEPRLIERDPVGMAVARVGLVDSLFEADGVYAHRHPQVPVLGQVGEIVHLHLPALSDLLEREIQLIDAHHPIRLHL